MMIQLHKIGVLATLACLFIYSGCKKEISDPDNQLTISFTQSKIGTRLNIQDSGAWWGEQIVKIVEFNGSIFTLSYVDDSDERLALLNKSDLNGTWSEGCSFVSSRMPSLLVVIEGFIHLVGFEPFSKSYDFAGRLFHVKFTSAEDISGSYIKTYITEDTSNDTLLLKERFASIFYGATIAEDNTILTVYNNSPDINKPGQNSIGARISKDKGESWAYENVASGLMTNYAYPFAFVSSTYLHVLAIEDQYDEEYLSAGSPYDEYPYRYGQVRHWQRLRSGGAWEETILINLNETLTKKEIWNSILRIHELYVDQSDTVHVILRHKKDRRYKAFHYTKEEAATTWSNQMILPTKDLYWAKMWENDQHELFYILKSFGKQLWLTPCGTTDTYTISDLSWSYALDMTPFPANLRGGTNLSSDLHVVVYGGSSVIEGYHIKVAFED